MGKLPRCPPASDSHGGSAFSPHLHAFSFMGHVGPEPCVKRCTANTSTRVLHTSQHIVCEADHRESADSLGREVTVPHIFRPCPVSSQTHVVTCLLFSPYLLRSHFFWLINTKDRPKGHLGTGPHPAPTQARGWRGAGWLGRNLDARTSFILFAATFSIHHLEAQFLLSPEKS